MGVVGHFLKNVGLRVQWRKSGRSTQEHARETAPLPNLSEEDLARVDKNIPIVSEEDVAHVAKNVRSMRKGTVLYQVSVVETS